MGQLLFHSFGMDGGMKVESRLQGTIVRENQVVDILRVDGDGGIWGEAVSLKQQHSLEPKHCLTFLE